MKQTLIFIIIAVMFCNSQSLFEVADFYCGTEILKNVTKLVLEEQFNMRKFTDNQLKVVDEMCAVLDHYEHYHEFASTSNNTSITSVDKILGEILNDGCEWLESLLYTNNTLNCSNNDASSMAVLCLYRKVINTTSSLLNNLGQRYPNLTPDPSEANYWAEELTLLVEQNDTVIPLLKMIPFLNVHKGVENINN